MRNPGVSVFCVAASLLGALTPHPDLSVNGGLIEAKCKKV